MKEKGIHDRLLSRMIQDLDRLRSRVERGALVVPAKIERAVGRIQQRYPGLCRWVDVEVGQSDGKTELLWRLKEEMAGEARYSEGLYLLRTNLAADSAENVWKGYIAYVLLWSIEHTHRRGGGGLTGRRALDVLSGIEMGTITLRAGDGRKLELERISAPRPEEAEVISTLGIQLPRHSRTNRRSDWQLCLIENGDKTGQQNAHIELKPAAKLAKLG